MELRGGADVVVLVGGSRRVEITADTAVQRHVDTFIDNGVLIIDTQQGWNWDTTNVGVAISVPALEGFELNGGGSVVIRGVAGDEFSMAVDGAGDVAIDGSATHVTVSLSGAGSIDASALVGQHVIAKLDGAGEIDVFAAQTLDADLSGVGVIKYHGDPAVTKSVDGVGSVEPA